MVREPADAAQLPSLADGRPTDDCWHTTDRALLEAVDELHATFDLSDDTWGEPGIAVADEDAALDLVLGLRLVPRHFVRRQSAQPAP